jgi:hypothetical protein
MAKDSLNSTFGRKSSITTKPNATWNFPLSKMNMIYLLGGLGVIIVGYLLMATGISSDPATVDGKWNNPMAVVVAPFLLVIGYCAVIPYGIMKMFKSNKNNNPENEA